jgi:plastocyanin
MSRRKHARVGLAAVVVLVAAAVAVPAFAATPPSRVVQKIVGGGKFVPNRFVSDTMHFKKDVVRIRKGGRIVLVDTTHNAHTFSIVRKRQQPSTLKAVDNCFGKGPCDEIAIAHGAVNPQTGEEQEPTKPRVNVGKAGFNKPGDSIVIPPNGRRTVRVTADRDLYYICAIHPWMQGKIDVPPLG